MAEAAAPAEEEEEEEELPEGFRLGDLVEIHGLQGARELNGKWGRIVAFVKQTSRLGVKLDGRADGVTKSIRPDNLRKVTPRSDGIGSLDRPMPEAFMRTAPGTPVFKLLLRYLPAEALLALARCSPTLQGEAQGSDEAWAHLLSLAFGGDLPTARRRCPGAASAREAFAGLRAAWRALGAVEIVRGSLTDAASLGVEAVVCPANASLEPYGPAARAIFERAGPELMEHVQALQRPVEVGSAVWTPGFGLGTTGLVHAAGPHQRTPNGDQKLHAVYAAALEQVLEHGHKSVAFGSISTGGNGFEVEGAAMIAAEEIRSALARSEAARQLRIVIVAFEAEVQDAFREALSSIRQRVNEDLLEVLPIVVLDSMLPRQCLTVACDQPFSAIHKGVDRFGMVGLQRTLRGPVPIPCGVEVRVRSRRGLAGAPDREELELVAGRRFRLPGSIQREDLEPDALGRSFLQASVQWAPEEPDTPGPGEYSISRSLEPLVDQWLHLVRDGHERQPGQMDHILEDLGPMPPAGRSTERALWVCALINPLPGLGVAYEIRPSALMAGTARKRLEVARQGLHDSIANLDGSRPLRTG